MSKQQNGFGLVEVLVSLLLMSLVMSLFINQYVMMKQRHQTLQKKLEQLFELQSTE